MTFSMTAATVASGPSEPLPTTGQPVGLPVANPRAGPLPGPVTLKGRYGRLEKLRPDHWSDLWVVFAGHDQLWTYIATAGPFSNASEFSSLIAMRAAAEDPYAYAIIDPQDRAIGYVTLLRIAPVNRVIEVGHVMYSPALQRTPLGTETQYLLARYVFETLGYRRYEWKCDSLNAPSRRAALRYGFVYEGTFRQHIIARQGRQSRRRLVFHARQRMAGAQAQLRALAEPRQFRRTRQSKSEPRRTQRRRRRTA